MRDYIIINGVHSKEIEGLLISTLPPISKPKIRTERLEINGRDGDIVTPLGYSAYDKSFEIGLTYNYDVDDVIAFFDTSGTVIFSNEPDKYYNFQMIEQIDLEKLLRFKKATVTMHVQPFKYSAAENEKDFDIGANLLNLKSYNNTSNGLTISVSNNVIKLSGTSTAAVEFYAPINALTLKAASYLLSATASGTLANACSIRLIQSVPSNAESFGGNYLALQNNATATLSATLTGATTYNYLWFYITANKTLNFTLNVSVADASQSVNVINSGNIYSKPIITIQGTGDIALYLNSAQVFALDMTNTSEVIINVAEMNAYYSDGTYANRLVTGDYDDFLLNVGTNTISWTGSITDISIDNYSRWI